MPMFNQLPKKAFIHGDKIDITHLKTKFEGVDVFSIPTSGHFMMLDNPANFYSLISKYLDR
jgi:hypothetical protein